MGTIIGLIIIVVAIFLNRKLKVDAPAKSEEIQPMNEGDNGDAWGRINTPNIGRIPYQRKNPDNGDEDYQSDSYNTLLGKEWGSNTASPDGYVPMYREDFASSYNDSKIPPIFGMSEMNPLADSSENNITDFSLDNYDFNDTLAVEKSEIRLAESISENKVYPDNKTALNFKLRDAIIYTAILNPKFKELDIAKGDPII